MSSYTLHPSAFTRPLAFILPSSSYKNPSLAMEGERAYSDIIIDFHEFFIFHLDDP